MIYNKLVATPIFYQCVSKWDNYFANGAHRSNNEIFSWTIYTKAHLRSAEYSQRWNPQCGRPLWNMLYWMSRCISTQSVNLRLTVNGGQPQLTIGLPMFTLSLENFLYVLWGPSTNIDIFIHVKIIVFEGKKYWFSWKRLSFEDLLVAPLMPSWTWLMQASSWPLAGAMCYGGLEAHWRYLRYWF